MVLKLNFLTFFDCVSLALTPPLQYVVSVGGTSLHLDANNNRASEAAWSQHNNNGKMSGSGCSGNLTKPSYQTDPGARVSRVTASCKHMQDTWHWQVVTGGLQTM